MSNRLGIMVLFDPDNIITEADIYLAKQVKSVVNRLIICVNSDALVDTSFLRPFCDDLIIRDNKGFDGGAVKEILVEYLGRNQSTCYDELFICNNSFFGPFVPMTDIFQRIEQLECDYWGLSGVDEKYSAIINGVGTYFWGIRNTILRDDDFWDYINECIDSKSDSFLDICATYENGLNDFLSDKYRMGIVYELNNLSIFDAADVVLINYGFPVLKRKFFAERRTDNRRIKNVLRYIKSTGYRTEWVEEKIRRIYGICVTSDDNPFDKVTVDEEDYKVYGFSTRKEDIEAFLKANSEVYIYGTGHLATLIWGLFGRKYSNIKGFVVSSRGERHFYYDRPVFEPSELDVNSGIIVALNADNSRQVEEKISHFKTLFIR